MIRSRLEVDGFLPNADAVREVAVCLPFGPKTHDGTTYQGVAEDPGLVPLSLLEEACGFPIQLSYSFFRAGTLAWEPNTYIHADNAMMGELAAVLYLCEPPAAGCGTAFWSHRELGLHYLPNPDYFRSAGLEPTDELYRAFDREGGEQERWNLVGLSGMAYNRLIVYPTCVWHSRFPRAGWGETPADCRLTWSAFFSPAAIESPGSQEPS